MIDSTSILFGGGSIDRAAHLRGEAEGLLGRGDARVTVLWRGKALFDAPEAPRLAWLPPDAPILADAAEPPIFLGLEDGAPRFAFDISAWDDPDADAEAMAQFVDRSTNRHPAMSADQAFLDLRGAMSVLDPVDAGNAAAAKGIFGWHDSHRFCARCGAPSEVSLAGWRRTCQHCGSHHFPRTDPVVIMLITHGSRLLLGRSPGWPEAMFSLLAGFVEPGETLEGAVRRETLEEAGIEVGRVGYLASQPWPFPASLMIGCWGEALGDAITLDLEELEDARWVTREELMEAQLGGDGSLRPARKGAIAHFLIREWLAGRLAGVTG